VAAGSEARHVVPSSLFLPHLGRPDGPQDALVAGVFGVLPESFDLAKDPINPYETDKAYWRSLRHRSAEACAQDGQRLGFRDVPFR